LTIVERHHLLRLGKSIAARMHILGMERRWRTIEVQRCLLLIPTIGVIYVHALVVARCCYGLVVLVGSHRLSTSGRNHARTPATLWTKKLVRSLRVTSLWSDELESLLVVICHWRLMSRCRSEASCEMSGMPLPDVYASTGVRDPLCRSTPGCEDLVERVTRCEYCLHRPRESS
jgi:hypothetical protein